MATPTTVHERFRAQARRTPDDLAVVGEDRALTYRQLDEESDALAGFLQTHGVGPDRSVGILMHKCVDYVVACMAALKAGGAYLPLDMAYPEALLSKILRQTASPVVITHSTQAGRVDPFLVGRILELDQEEAWRDHALDADAPRVGPDHLAYVVFSSGTTGEPKGILAPHRGAVHSYDERHRFHPYAVGDRVACNVFFVWEFFRPLFRGATVHVIPDDVIYDPRRLVRFLSEHRITEMLFTPSLLDTVLSTIAADDLRAGLATLDTLWLNGEVVTERLRTRALQVLPAGVRLLNTYSISECHDVASLDLGDARASDEGFCPVGQPIDGIVVRILDSRHRRVEEGGVGEVWVGGPCLARGYLNRSDLTAERFVDIEGERLYRTGDFGLRRPDGLLEIRGRCDFMVKIRGYSVHLDAVEATLERLSGVDSCVVLAEGAEGEDKRLVAWVVRAPGADWTADPKTGTCVALRNRLKAHLAEYMIPSTYVEIDALPLSAATGKLDTGALPAPPARGATTDAADDPVLADDADHAARLAAMRALWARVLSLAPEAVHDDVDFFDLGGHSLLAVDLSTRVERVFGVTLEVRQVYDHPRLSGLVEALEAGEVRSSRDTPQFLDDARLDDTFEVASAHKPLALGDAKEVFFTGGTGFLGAFLLEELLRTTGDEVTVHCLVRAPTSARARERVRETLARYGLWQPTYEAKLRALPGDLSLPHMGLDSETWDALARQIDFVFHCAATVNFVYPYALLKPATVDGTLEVLRLAATGVAKPLHYVSTNGIFPGDASDGATFGETSDIDGFVDRLGTGYGQAKWVAEKLVWQAMERGLPVCIYRPGNLGHHSETGVANPNDLQYHLLEAMLTLGTAPRAESWTVELTPVDFVARSVVELARDPEHLGGVFHVMERHPVAGRDVLLQLLRRRQVRRLRSRDEWLAELRVASEERGDATLQMLARTLDEVELYLADVNDYDTTRFEEALDKAGLARPTPDDAYLDAYLDTRTA